MSFFFFMAGLLVVLLDSYSLLFNLIYNTHRMKRLSNSVVLMTTQEFNSIHVVTSTIVV